MTHSRTAKFPLPRDLGHGLVLRRATPADADALATFNSLIHRPSDTADPSETIAGWTRDLALGNHPTFTPGDFTIVEDTATGAIVSSLNLISQTWTYDGIPFGVGRPELVGTHPDYRRRGLIRAQFQAIHEWSAERGELVQAITGIPWYYRQFGYELALALGGGRTGSKADVPALRDGQAPPYRIRCATEADIPLIAEVYAHSIKRQPIACVRNEAIWRYELSGRGANNGQRRDVRIIETPAGEPLGYLTHSPRVRDGRIWLSAYELKPGVSWLEVTPGVLRYLRATGEEYAARPALAGDGREFDVIAFRLGIDHPSHVTVADRLPVVDRAYAWYIRVPDLPGFLRQVAPALEARLACSAAAGHTGELKISFYRHGARLALERGRLVAIEPWDGSPRDPELAAFPDLTFLQLLFGYRTVEELEHAFADCFAGAEVRVLLNALFPRCHSAVWPVS